MTDWDCCSATRATENKDDWLTTTTPESCEFSTVQQCLLAIIAGKVAVCEWAPLEKEPRAYSNPFCSVYRIHKLLDPSPEEDDEKVSRVVIGCVCGTGGIHIPLSEWRVAENWIS